ncbi:STAS domain-containing protein [Actinomadura opuntiae]|uniref:STAS domain-containing protein n=1 Tax=Actinomadura sp. OS1-43 TaxID=604315 RepID=UPI00255A92FD|nr:STAS domain-containing protein [Actinomadura sp. OS1-43]MDL4813738.1 STAS domain-containing protein [Actinomadura sp. OS1-43]
MGLIVESRFQPAGADLAVVTLTGDLDVASAGLLRGHLAALIGRGADHLILDFAQVDFVDSNGLSVLAGVHRLMQPSQRARADGDLAGTLAVAAVNQRVRHVLRTTGFTRIIPIYPSVETAVVVHQAGPHRPAGKGDPTGTGR